MTRAGPSGQVAKWGSVSTTLDLYAHAEPGGDAQAAATIWQIMQASA